MKLIDKDALVAEIEGLKSAAETMLTGKTDLFYWKAQKFVSEKLLSFIDTLEVKEVGLEKELSYDDYVNFFEEHPECDNKDWGYDECWVHAKHFFELGIKAQKEQMMAKAEKVEISCASFAPLSSGNYKAGDKLIIIKEE